MSENFESFESLVDQMFKVRLEGESDPARIEKLKRAQEMMRNSQREMQESLAKIKDEYQAEQARLAEISAKNREIAGQRQSENDAFRDEGFATIELHTNLINAIAEASKNKRNR
ncbi:MAG TPA: hypothetical protein VK171_04435 [Fimbriimonas sp.]|nr:hypothetical protein [Fimbriimonas sp.]